MRGGGFFFGGSLFDHVSPDMRIYREEIFGPVLAMVRAQSFTEALQLVNDHEFGGIGFLPDAWASFFLSRLPGAIGMHPGLAGPRLTRPTPCMRDWPRTSSPRTGSTRSGMPLPTTPATPWTSPSTPGGRPCGSGRQGPQPHLATCVARRTNAAGLSISAMRRTSPSPGTHA
ncbi:methylmalonate-semialdehyde dehydrogenase [Streptomyces bingchenggensis BCW-1]|uniref:Methylmalonate-semialdehyde dehydrogenase n=1 Tax=Streptomyces bingchenggensis (strain BCW-1) TaxID=749414 RepID=D7C9Z3_STRBB|nr:methylmalonate-semialdehyde dehydrogenase [Streptomyces bingchenggensis BCW-1]